jgi:hypothetical protein
VARTFTTRASSSSTSWIVRTPVRRVYAVIGSLRALPNRSQGHDGPHMFCTEGQRPQALGVSPTPSQSGVSDFKSGPRQVVKN